MRRRPFPWTGLGDRLGLAEALRQSGVIPIDVNLNEAAPARAASLFYEALVSGSSC